MLSEATLQRAAGAGARVLAGGDSQGTVGTRGGLSPRPCDLPEGARPPGGAGWQWLLDRPLGAPRPSTAWGSLSRIFLLCQMKVGFYENQHQEKKECPPGPRRLAPPRTRISLLPASSGPASPSPYGPLPVSALLVLLIGTFVSRLMGWNNKSPKEDFIPDENESSLPGRERRWISRSLPTQARNSI